MKPRADAKPPAKAADPQALMTTEQVAELLAVQPRTVEQWRQARRGPRYVLLGRAVRYRPSDIDTWLSACMQEPAQ